jgi:hypothetical protein
MSPEVLTADTISLHYLTNPPEDRLYLRNITASMPTDQLVDIARYVVGSEMDAPVVYYPVSAKGDTVSVPTVDLETASAMVIFLEDQEDNR